MRDQRLKVSSRKHRNQVVVGGTSIAFLLLGVFPLFRRLVLIAVFLALASWFIVLALKRISPVEWVKRVLMVHQVEVELLRSDFIWREVSADRDRGHTMVELPSVSVLTSTQDVRVISVANSLKFQERLLKSDLSAVFAGWVATDVELNQDKSAVHFTFTRVGADLVYHFDGMRELVEFAKRRGISRLPLDRLSEVKMDSHLAVTGRTGSGKSMALVYVVLYYVAKGWMVAIADPKNSDLAMLGRSLKLRVAVDSQDIIDLINEACKFMDERKYKLQKRQEFGRSAVDLGYSGLLLVVDEFASLSLKMDKKQSAEFYARIGNLVLEGRQLGIFLALSMQQANYQVVPTSIREQLGTKLVMGQSDEQTYVTLFGASAGSEVRSMRVEQGQGWMVADGRARPVFIRMPWLSSSFISDVQGFIKRRSQFVAVDMTTAIDDGGGLPNVGP